MGLAGAGAHDAPGAGSRASGSSSVDADSSALVRRAQGGDPQAFRILVDVHRDRVYSLALRILADAATAEEAAQDAFVKAWRALPSFRGDSRFSTWIYRITYRTALDHRQARRRVTTREVALDPGEFSPPDPAAMAPNSAWGLKLRLERLLSLLEEKQRTCLTLHYLGEQSVAEIAEILDIPTGTVKTHLHRGRHALRELWDRAAKKEGPLHDAT